MSFPFGIPTPQTGGTYQTDVGPNRTNVIAPMTDSTMVQAQPIVFVPPSPIGGAYQQVPGSRLLPSPTSGGMTIGGPPPVRYINDSPIGGMGGQQVPTAPPFVPYNNPLNSQPVDNPYLSSGLPINEMAIATPLYENPAFAIDLTGAAQAGTPGYYNLANATPDANGMQALFLAIMGHAPTSPTEYLNFLNNYYATLGTLGSQGGGTLNARAVMGSLVNADPNSQLGQLIASDPSQFYAIASDALKAGGAPPIAQQGLQSQMMQLYQEYFNYSATSDANATQPFNVWLKTTHPDVVAAWTQGG
jgi:hypothetical protein